MNKSLLIPITLLLIFEGCNNRGTQKQVTQTDRNESTEKVVKSALSSEVLNAFDWTKPLFLKEKLLTGIKEKNDPVDVVLMDFIVEYSKLAEEFENVLNELSCYDSLNTLAYSEDGKIFQSALDFERKVENSGFRIASAEGMIYITENTEFIKSQVMDLIDAMAQEFINLYCNEFDTISCSDAAIVIPENAIVSRIFRWGDLYDKASALKYARIAEAEFYRNLSLLYVGQDNTPAFDWETNRFNESSLNIMKGYIRQYPNSKAAREFETYIELLASEDYMRTEKVIQFLKEKFN
jgi:hypothetical protein